MLTGMNLVDVGLGWEGLDDLDFNYDHASNYVEGGCVDGSDLGTDHCMLRSHF